MASPNPRRSKSDPPPPITVEDTATGAAPQPSPSPTRMTEQARSFSAYEPRPKPEHWESHNVGVGGLKQRKDSTLGHKRQRSPGIEWHEKWTEESWRHGRVLLIDYVAKEHTKENRRKIYAQEFSDIDGLHRFYRNDSLSRQAALRVIHVQNAPWATRFLLRKFNITASDDLVGTTFAPWARYEHPRRRGTGSKAKPVLSGKTFRAQRDPWRGISRAAFGLDYLKHYPRGSVAETVKNQGMKMMELNHYDLLDNPAYGYDVYAQRMSVYVQLSDGEPGLPVDPDIRNPYNEEERREYERLKNQYRSESVDVKERYIPKLQTLDNGSTVILFEHSQSGSVNDTLVGARQEIEQRWRRLTFYLPREETSSDERLAEECMDFILRDIFKALAFNWEKYINICETHISILEDKIYDNPADESRAPELWTNSSLWLKVERIIYTHTDIVKEMRTYLKEMSQDDQKERETGIPVDPWLVSSVEELEKLITQFEEGVIKPTTNLSDLMYKSVGIRDAKHSLQLGLSMWRLSWITFIFLPLTFVCGFFGMNVDTFENNPPIKWWFITTVPLFAIVITLWYSVKHTLASQRRDPLRRGVYEALFHDLANEHPAMWTRRGPREDIVPIGWWSAMKWGLITKWFDPEQTIAKKGHDPGDEELGAWSRTKRFLAKRWLRRIAIMPQNAAAQTTSALDALDTTQEFGAVGELLQLATPIALADGDPTAASRIRKRTPLETLRRLSPTRSEGGRPGSGVSGRTSADGGGSGIMVEERSGDEEEEERDTRFVDRLNVPLYPGGAGIVAGGL